MKKRLIFIGLIILVATQTYSQCFIASIPEDAVALFNGKDFTNWKVPVGDNNHWRVVEEVVDYDAESEAIGDKNLWTEKSYKDFVLYIDWRIKETPWENPRVPIILPSGLNKKDANGKDILTKLPDSDSGILLRGSDKSQCNIWRWPIGSGEVYGYRTDPNVSEEVRKAVTPIMNADHNVGEWNTFIITLIDNVLTVNLNGQRVIVNAKLPGLPESGPIGLQHHGTKRDGEWISPPALVQFRNIYIREI